jgi:hypothetical protein
MERRRSQQQRIKQQQRFCVSQQDLTQAIARMKPQRRATHDNLLNISSPSPVSSSSAETLTVPSVSQLIEEFEARAVSTPYVSAQDFLPTDNEAVPNGAESNCFHAMSVQTIQTKVDNISSSISRLNDDNNQIHQDQFTRDKEQETTKKKQIRQTLLNNDRYKRDLPPSSSSSSYYSTESNNSTTPMFTRNSKRYDPRFNEILVKEAELNNALADLISLSNDADISSSISSSSRSLINNSQRRRASSTNDNTNSISASIALLNNLLETFDLDIDDYKNKKSKNEDEHLKPTNTFG